MFDRLRSVLLATLAWTAFVAFTRATSAAESGATAQRERAAASFDAGVSAYDHGDSAAAARHFLEADRLLPNEDALANALVAAQRAGNVDLVREAAERILARPGVKPELSSAASSALTVERANATSAVVASTDPAPAQALRPMQSTPDAVSEAQAHDGAHASTSDAWARPAFYTGVGVTAVLTGLTIWSGLDALSARDSLPGTQAQNDSVEARAHRTDALLLGTVVAAAGTAYIGLRWVEWGDSKPVEVAAQVTPTRAFVAVGGRF